MGVGIIEGGLVFSRSPIEPGRLHDNKRSAGNRGSADKFHTKSLPPRFVSEQTARARVEKFGSENARWDNR